MVELVRSLRGQPLWMGSGALVLLALAVLPFFLNGYGQQVMMIGYFYVMLGISWNILAGYTGQFALAQHAFATIGAYVSAAMVLGFAASLPCYLQLPGFYIPLPCALAAVTVHLPLPLGIAVGTLVAALLGYGLGWVTLGMRGVYFAISTWAFAESVRILLSINYKITRGDMGLPVPYLFDTPDPFPYYYVFFVASVLTLLLNAAMLRMKIGYRMRAIRDDQELAVASGVDVVKWKRLVFMLSTALAGLAGALYGHSIGLLTPSQAHFSQMAFVVIAVVLGGFRTLWGPVIGALLAQGLAEALRFSAEWRFVIFALLVIVIVRVYPPGIMGFIYAAVERLRRRAAPGRPQPAVVPIHGFHPLRSPDAAASESGAAEQR
jgi:branched-chain amino acid transport system permease protein